MPEEQKDAKDDFELNAEKVFTEAGKETPPESSPENKPGEEGKSTDEPAGAEPEKTEQVKDVEADGSLSVEEKIEKVKEILGDDQNAIDAYVKEKGYHNDPAWQKQRERIDTLEREVKAQSVISDEDRTALEDFKSLSSSPEFIQMTMKNKGFTQEAIDKELQEKGFDVQTKPEDDFQFILDKTNTKKEDLNEGQISQIEDQIKIANLLIDEKMSKILPKELEPIKDHISNSQQSEGASKMVTTFKEVLKTEGILDFDKDIEPVLNKFMDDNPDATQQDVQEHFRVINHSLTIERLKTSKGKQERDEMKDDIRQNTPMSKGPANVAAKTGNFDADADAFFEKVAID